MSSLASWQSSLCFGTRGTQNQLCLEVWELSPHLLAVCTQHFSFLCRALHYSSCCCQRFAICIPEICFWTVHMPQICYGLSSVCDSCTWQTCHCLWSWTGLGGYSVTPGAVLSQLPICSKSSQRNNRMPQLLPFCLPSLVQLLS